MRLAIGAMKAFWLALLYLSAACVQAHMMVAQHGTLNLEGGSAYLLASLPVSSLTGYDDDGDQRLSRQELQRHANGLQQQLTEGMRLVADGQIQPFELLSMNTAPPDDVPGAPASQLMVMGRYVLGAGVRGASANLQFSVHLFGKSSEERQLDMAFTGHGRAQTLRFTNEAPTRTLFASGLALLAEQVQSGADHVLTGEDHLLFLLVVLADGMIARRGWSHALLLLTSFTLGHGITLTATALGGLALPAFIVEPAIAASIVLMAIFSVWQRHSTSRTAPRAQLAMVFGCALVHGLGLGGALQAQGWQGADLYWALAGFNLGVEAAQLAVAAMMAGVITLLRRLKGAGAARPAAHSAALAAALVGFWWWIERSASFI